MTADFQAHAETVMNVIRLRRTVPYQHVADSDLCPEHLRQLLEAANWAPTHKHTEPWRFTLFTGEGRRRIAQVLSHTYQQRCGPSFNQKKYDKTATRPLQVGAVIAVVIEFSGKLPQYEEILAVGAAVQNLQLAAHALGIGCSWSTPGYLDDPAIANLLHLKETMRCYGFLYLGYFKSGAALLKSTRVPVDEKTVRVDR